MHHQLMSCRTHLLTHLVRSHFFSQAQILAKQVLRVHACGGCCEDSTRAAEVMASEDRVSFTLPGHEIGLENFSCNFGTSCSLFDLSAWSDVKHRASLSDELQSTWHETADPVK